MQSLVHGRSSHSKRRKRTGLRLSSFTTRTRTDQNMVCLLITIFHWWSAGNFPLSVYSLLITQSSSKPVPYSCSNTMEYPFSAWRRQRVRKFWFVYCLLAMHPLFSTDSNPGGRSAPLENFSDGKLFLWASSLSWWYWHLTAYLGLCFGSLFLFFAIHSSYVVLRLLVGMLLLLLLIRIESPRLSGKWVERIALQRAAAVEVYCYLYEFKTRHYAAQCATSVWNGEKMMAMLILLFRFYQFFIWIRNDD